jgi:transcriptional regulator of acetoin/glycerol metabolism
VKSGGSAQCNLPCNAIPEISKLFTPKQALSFLGKTGASLVNQERKRFQKAIIDAHGDRDKAAVLLSLSRATYFRRAKELGLVAQRRPSVN